MIKYFIDTRSEAANRYFNKLADRLKDPYHRARTHLLKKDYTAQAHFELIEQLLGKKIHTDYWHIIKDKEPVDPSFVHYSDTKSTMVADMLNNPEVFLNMIKLNESRSQVSTNNDWTHINNNNE